MLFRLAQAHHLHSDDVGVTPTPARQASPSGSLDLCNAHVLLERIGCEAPIESQFFRESTNRRSVKQWTIQQMCIVKTQVCIRVTYQLAVVMRM